MVYNYTQYYYVLRFSYIGKFSNFSVFIDLNLEWTEL